MTATNSIDSGIAGQLSAASTAWFTLPMALVAKALPRGFRRTLADGDAVERRVQSTHSGTGDAPYEHR